jgi:hypothetical protein
MPDSVLSDTALPETGRAPKPATATGPAITLPVEGMTCASCVGQIGRAHV